MVDNLASSADIRSKRPLTTSSHSAVGHDNEVMALAAQSGRLFAATDQWEYSGPAAHGQILVKNSSHDPWRVFVLRCLGGRQFTPSPHQPSPARSGQAFVSIRTIKPSPFRDGRLYYAGYDCNFHPADGAAWIGASTLSATQLDNPRKAATP